MPPPEFPKSRGETITPGHMKSCLEHKEVGCKAQHLLSPIYQLSDRGNTCPANISTLKPIGSVTSLGQAVPVRSQTSSLITIRSLGTQSVATSL